MFVQAIENHRTCEHLSHLILKNIDIAVAFLKSLGMLSIYIN